MKRPAIISLSMLVALSSLAEDNVTASVSSARQGKMSNGILSATIEPGGRLNVLKHSSSNVNLLSSNGIYFDYTAEANSALSAKEAKVVKLTDDYAEIQYINNSGDLHVTQGYIMRKGVSGVYTYVIFEGTPTSSNVSVREARVCTRTQPAFTWGYVSDTMKGDMPTCSEMTEAEKSENTIQDATYRLADGSIYTKYDWANFIVDDMFHGLVSPNRKLGVWNITASHEWLNGGPMRQELTVHSTSKSPITIQMLQGEHLGGAAQTYEDGEVQIFGPFLIYVNSGETPEDMVADARSRAAEESEQWPYQWFDNEYYPLDRSTVQGQIRFTTGQSSADMQVVLCEPGGEIITQGKKYIYWGKTDENGYFSIPHVRKGDYALRVYALDGTITEEFEYTDVTVEDTVTDLGLLYFYPETYDNLLWSIGVSDRLSDGYAISNHPRAYGLWNDVPASLTFIPGTSDPATDWYYAQCKNGTWTVKFNLDEEYEGDAHLTASSAAATNRPTVAVKVNDEKVASWYYGYNDASIYRSATQAGRHALNSVTFPASKLRKGENTVSFTMSGINKNGGVMWDCIKLEAGERVVSGIADVSADSEVAGPYDIYTVGGLHVATAATLDDLDLPKGLYIYRCGTKAGKIVM
ncbi:MAG: hypothetical protein HDR83_00225 [Bacteroides sp.]|nr:hypothetical protein [Bacteroides sp.]MBD5367678.1 hypothetical protein [Bacteroides sp.]